MANEADEGISGAYRNGLLSVCITSELMVTLPAAYSLSPQGLPYIGIWGTVLGLCLNHHLFSLDFLWDITHLPFS